jgi:ATP-independent RNA helicase DbpA
VTNTTTQNIELSAKLKTVMEELGYNQLTPIQEKSIPLLLAGKDLVGQSKTGSGKTAAFSLPILNQIDLTKNYIQALILCPTRELANQVVGELRKLGRRHEGLKILALVGGQPGREQAESIENGVHIAVGTPGRILDHLNRERLDLNEIQTLVLDEADKMFDMGFEVEIKSILKQLPTKRQTVLFSATFPEAIESLSRRYQKNPITVRVEENHGEKSGIEQIVYDTDIDSNIEKKINTLMRVLQQHPSTSTIIFCNMKNTVNEINAAILEREVTCAALHGDLEQRDRDRVMTLFRNGSLPILVATDIAARGLDIENLELVVNFDMPNQAETYVHRIGRTGRAGKLGVAVTLASPRDTLRLSEFEALTGGTFSRPLLGFKNQFGLNKFALEPAMQTLSISGGRKEKIRAGDILGALTGEAGIQAVQVGKIEIHDHYSYVAIATSISKEAFEFLRNGKIKGKKFQIRVLT